MNQWSAFLHQFGRYLVSVANGGRFPAAFLVLPTLDCASSLIASGIVIESIDSASGDDERNLDLWQGREGEAVVFPKFGDQQGRLIFAEGVVKGLDVFRGRRRLLITHYDDFEGRSHNSAVYEDMVDLIVPLDGNPELRSRTAGRSIAVQNYSGLKAIFSDRAISQLLTRGENLCCLVHSRAAINQAAGLELNLAKLGYYEKEGAVLLEDILRPESANRAAVSRGYCSKIAPVAEDGWKATIFAGSARILKGFESSQSDICVGLMTATEAGFNDANRLAERLFERRDYAQDFALPSGLLAMKPSCVDMLLFSQQ